MSAEKKEVRTHQKKSRTAGGNKYQSVGASTALLADDDGPYRGRPWRERVYTVVSEVF